MLAERAGALDWQNMYAEERGDEEANPLPLMAERDVSTGPCIAPYLATESSVVVQVAATHTRVGSATYGLHMLVLLAGQ